MKLFFSNQNYELHIWGYETGSQVVMDCFLIERKEGLFSEPLTLWKQEVEEDIYRKYYKGKDNFRVVRDIVTSYMYSDITKKANDGVPIFFGIGQEPEIENLTIGGEKPDEVRRITYKNKEFYFWYYMDGRTIEEKCKQNTELRYMTMDEAVDYFEIKME